MKSYNKLKLLLTTLPMAMLTACATTTPFAVTDEERAGDVAVIVACDAFSPITYSRTDTEETIQQVREHNARWTAICGQDNGSR